MILSTFKTRLRYNCGNIPTTHELVTGTNGGGDFINEALRYMLLRASQRYPNFELFPEHKDVEWTDITIIDQNYLALPNDQIAIQRVSVLESATVPNLNNSDWRPLSYIEPVAFDQLEKPTTTLQYPALFTLREGRVYVHPTPRTTKTTYIKLDGIQDEVDLTAAGDSPRTHSRWHPAILDIATHLMKNALNHSDADQWLDKADEKIMTIGASMVGLRKAQYKRSINIAGAPRGGWY